MGSLIITNFEDLDGLESKCVQSDENTEEQLKMAFRYKPEIEQEYPPSDLTFKSLMLLMRFNLKHTDMITQTEAIERGYKKLQIQLPTSNITKNHQEYALKMNQQRDQLMDAIAGKRAEIEQEFSKDIGNIIFIKNSPSIKLDNQVVDLRERILDNLNPKTLNKMKELYTPSKE